MDFPLGVLDSVVVYYLQGKGNLVVARRKTKTLGLALHLVLAAPLPRLLVECPTVEMVPIAKSLTSS